MPLLLSSPHIPTQNPSIASVSSLPPSSSFSSQSSLGARSRGEPDASSVYSGSGSLVYGRAAPRDLQGQTSMHLVPPSPQPSANGGASGSVRSARSGRSRRSARSEGGDTLKSKRGGKADGIVPEHKIKFEEFHNQVRRWDWLRMKGGLGSDRARVADALSHLSSRCSSASEPSLARSAPCRTSA